MYLLAVDDICSRGTIAVQYYLGSSNQYCCSASEISILWACEQ